VEDIMTYSIVARDPETGDLGVAVQSHWFAAGQLVPWARSGVGAVATQAAVELSYGPRGLDNMSDGASAAEALEALLAEDEGRAVRQVAMVDASGRVAAHTGDRCIRMAGHMVGDGYSVQANMMLRDTVWLAMSEAYRSAAGDLAHRLLSSLEAAEGEAGDVRGRQAAGLVVVRGSASDQPWRDQLVNLRVDDHPAPLDELRRLLELRVAYDRMNLAEELELNGDAAGALREQEAASASFPGNAEFAFWTAISQAGSGRLADARNTVQRAYSKHPGWAVLMRRLAEDGFLELDEKALRALLPDPAMS
jgi:uncharacterized Ntn-hydrolase superfamily protein